jgi:hypothetical protein
MGAIVAFLYDLPTIWPIVFALVSTIILIYGIVRVVIGYKKWKLVMTMKQPTIENILALLFDMHQYLGKEALALHAIVPTKKQFKGFSRSVLKSLKISEQRFEKEARKRNPEKYMRRQLGKVHKISEKDYATIAGFLTDLASALDEEGVGLKNARNHLWYQRKYAELNHLQLELPASITMPNLDLLERAYQASYGLHSVGLFMALAGNRYKGHIPERHVRGKELYMKNLDLMYRKVLFQAKKAILKSFVEEL